MKMLKSKKALSPVVASIILIAVTVAVSIAVAAWMGALTFTFTNTEQITFTAYSWGSASGTPPTVKYILITVKNTGAADLSIAEVRVDGVTATTNGTLPYALAKGNSVKLNVTKTSNYNSGTQYSFMVITAKGNQFGPYTQTAP
jgi:flagellin-like protein